MIEGFRGFRDRAEFDLDASAVLITGPNGTGKTSIFDALLWILVGDVARLSGYTLRRNEEYLLNAYVRGDGLARAEVELQVADRQVTASRVGSAAGSTLSVQVGMDTYSGREAEQALEDVLVQGQLPLREVMATSGLLQQDDLRQLLQTKPDQRYRQLLRLLGLESIERFDRYTASERDAKRSAVRDTRDVLERVRNETERMSEQLETAKLQASTTEAAHDATAQGIAAVVEQHSNVLRLETQPSTPEEFSSLAASARSIAAQVERVDAGLRALPDTIPVSPQADLEQAAVDGAQLRAALEQARELQRQAEEALRAATVVQDALGRLAAAALPLLPEHDETGICPVCQSTINPRQVAEDLSARAATGAAQAAAESVVRSAVEDVRRVEVAIETASRNESQLRAQSAERRELLTSLRRELDALESLQRQSASSGFQVILDVGSTLEAARTEERRGADMEEPEPANALFAAWTASHEEVLGQLRPLSQALGNLAAAAETVAAARTAVRTAAARAAALPGQQARYEEQLARLTQVQRAYDDARRAETAATALAQSVTSAATELFRERFAALEPLMNDIYARLDPHPSFTRLDFSVETYRSRGTATANVMDVDEHISANPMIVFSSAQANCVVLSAFLALGWASAERGVPFVLLDDPLQALDDVNVLGFADLARRLRRQRQLVLATHEDRFADLLERKLTGRAEGEDLIVHRFLGWSRSGPRVETRRISPRPDLQLRVLAAS